MASCNFANSYPCHGAVFFRGVRGVRGIRGALKVFSFADSDPYHGAGFYWGLLGVTGGAHFVRLLGCALSTLNSQLSTHS